MLHDLCPSHEMTPEPMEEGPTTQHLAKGPNEEAKKFYKKFYMKVVQNLAFCQLLSCCSS